jgi:hypothetical protein
MNYETHQREYTILGITSVIRAMVSEDLNKKYGGTFTEMISIIRDGVYFFSEVHGDREQLSRLFLIKVNNESIDFDREYRLFDSEVQKYEKLIDQDESNFSLETWELFYNFYNSLFPIAYAGMDSVDFIDELSPKLHESYIAWATKIRKRGEVIYKRGEMDFIPRYTSWLSKYLGSYSADELRYLFCDELINYTKNGIQLPSPEELRNRKKYCFIRQFPISQFELYSGEDAKKIIDEKGLLKSQDEKIRTIQEVNGRVA